MLREAIRRMSPRAKVGSVLWASVAAILVLLMALQGSNDGALVFGLIFCIWTFPGNLVPALFIFPLAWGISMACGALGLSGPANVVLPPLVAVTSIVTMTAAGWAAWFLWVPQAVIPFFKEMFTGRSS